MSAEYARTAAATPSLSSSSSSSSGSSSASSSAESTQHTSSPAPRTAGIDQHQQHQQQQPQQKKQIGRIQQHQLSRSPTYTASLHSSSSPPASSSSNTHHHHHNNQQRPKKSSLAFTSPIHQQQSQQYSSNSSSFDPSRASIGFPVILSPSLPTFERGGGGGSGGGVARKTRQRFNANGSPEHLSPTAAPRLDATSNQLEAKVVILGSQGVGKTSIIHRYTSGHFSNSLSSTIGASFLTKKLVVDGCKVRIQLWDTAGQERFRSMAPLYYRGALAAILVYDITNVDSFNDVKIWFEELRRNMSPDLIIHVVGSKADLAQTRRAVELQLAREAVADWVFDSLDSPTPSRSPSPSPNDFERPRSRTRSNQLLPTLGSSSSSISAASPRSRIPTISAPTTSPPLFQTSRAPMARTRLMSTTTTTSAAAASAASSTAAAAAAVPSSSSTLLPTSASTSSFLFSDLALNSEMTRSGSNFSLSLGGLGLGGSGGGGGAGTGGRSRRGTDEGRKSFEDVERIREERERERIAARIRDCGVEVTEVSAKDDIGIEDLFLQITQRLVERKVEIENARVLRSRDSIMLTETEIQATASASWCC